MIKKINKNPTVSVVMPVFNTERYVEEAILSVQRQTYQDWELIIMDDGSSDRSVQIIKNLVKSDSRIKFIIGKKNRGIGYTMTRLVRAARGKYIARMDSDDLMMQIRLETQVWYMENHPKVGVLGSYLSEFDGQRNLRAVRKVPIKHEDIVSGLFTSQTIQNPTLMLRVKAIPKEELYFDSTYSPVDDLEFFLRLVGAKVRFANIPEYLMYYRSHGENSSLKDIKKTFELSRTVREKFLAKRNQKLKSKQVVINALQKVTVRSLPNSILYKIYQLWKGNAVRVGQIAAFVPTRNFGLSIVMPVYQGEHMVEESVIRIINSIRSTGRNLELIAVVDGEVDKTKSILKAMLHKYPELKLLSYRENMGKGYAVRHGLKNAKYDYAGYIDAGHDIDTNSIVNMIGCINDNPKADVFIADKMHPMSQIINVQYFRKIYSQAFRLIVKLLFGINLGDTQVGLKFFRKEFIANLLTENIFRINRFAFDVELLIMVASREAQIVRIPVTIRRNGEISTVKMKDIWKMAWDLVSLKILNYGSKSRSRSNRGTVSGAYNSRLAEIGKV